VSSFAYQAFFTGLSLTLGVELVLFVGCWLLALAVGRWNVVDALWGLSFAAVALTSFGWAAGHGVPLWRRLLVVVMVVVWGTRLAGYIGIRSRGKGEDPRYAELIGDGSPRQQRLRALGIVFLTQAVIGWLVSLPVQSAMFTRSGFTPLAYIGVAVWVIGLFFEAVGDAQMAAFRADPANRGRVMDRGLWRYSRHPNYFGDATVWVGIWLVAAEHWLGATLVFSPLLMGWFLFFKSGKPLLEKSMSSSKPGYDEYVQRTSPLFPLPPKS
jgi:steroid 5-alpha reductase family enzyme